MKIYIDYDNTLINLIDPWILWINNKYNVNFTSNDINCWHFLGEVFGKEANDFWRCEENNPYADKNILQPHHGATEFLNTIQNQFGKNNVTIISSTMEHHQIEKFEHAQYYFGIKKEQFIPVNGHAEKHTFTKNGILVDDYPLNIMKHVHYNQQKGFVFNYNDSFGWCKKYNFILDKNLKKFINIVNDRKFNIIISYKQIIEDIDHA